MIASPHIFAIHGIRNELTDPQFPWKFAAYVDHSGVQARVETEHYKAGPFPRYNTHIVNPRVARALAARAIQRRELFAPAPIHIFTHSNGGPIGILLVKRLAQAGIIVDTLVMVASAAESDIRKSGLQALVDSGHLLKVVVYCSTSDPVIRNLQSFPGAYGSLGARGLQLDGETIGIEVDGFGAANPFAPYTTRWFERFRHNTWFDQHWVEATFQTALTDMGLAALPA